MAKASKKRTASSKTGFDISLDIIGLLLIALSLIGLATLFTSNEGSIGTVGLLIKKAATTMAGSGYGILLIIFILTGLRMMTRRRWHINSRFWGLMILFGSLQIFLHRQIPLADSLPIGLEGHGGGIIGGLLNYGLKYCFGNIGAHIFNLLFLILGISLFTGGTVRETIVGTWLKCKNGALKLLDQIMDFLFTTEDEDDTQEDTQKKNAKKILDENTLPVIDFQRPVLTTGPEVINEQEEPVENQQNTSADGNAADKTPHTHQGGQVYHLPPLSLLMPLPARPDNQTASKDINQRIKALEQILESFGIKAPVSHVSVGPSITRYELQPPPGVKVSKIVGLSDDIALGMATTGVRIEAPIPGKSAIGIEVPNEEISAVTLRELLEDKTFTASTSRLSVAFGKDIAGTAIVSDLAKMPHLLIAGATGSGKSVCVNTIICSVLYKATPDEVKFLMVDPKMVELTNYNGIPHLVSPVVTNAKKAAGALRWAVREMETRYDLFAAAGVRDIGRYNSLVGNDPGQGSLPMPYIIVIIDELADLMMVAPADVEDAICRLAQMARAAGIHLVVATQRPSVDVITGLIKANIPSRLSFAVSSQIDSRTILDVGGAEKLLGKGDMLFHPVGASKPIRVQGAFISDEDVESLVDFLKEQARPVYNEEILETNLENEALSFEDVDELLAQAVKLFIESGTASISLLQRRLHIGYARAARLVDIMEQRGIVGGFEGSKPRAVLMTMELYRQTFESESEAV